MRQRLAVLPCLAVLASLPVALPAQTLHVAPGAAAQAACSAQAPCSLRGAQARVRALRAAGAHEVVVKLAGGTYRLRAPLRFDARDSGAPGHPVRWRAAPGAHPVLVGSRRVRGRRNGAMWVFPVRPDDGLSSIYVGGQRRWPARTAACPHCVVDAKGVSGVPPAIRRLLRVGSMARLHARWRDFHCRVIALGPARADLAQPCWHNAALDSAGNGWAVASPVGKYYRGMDGFEGIAGAPATPGRFTVAADARRLSYRPLPDERGQLPWIEVPVAEQLLRVDGSSHLVFSGLGFAFTAWRKPGSDDGYVSLQAGYLVDGEGRARLPDNGEGMTRSGTAVTVLAARHVVFEHDRFMHLAAGGIALAGGTHGAAVTHSRFTDLGGGGVFAGDIAAHPAAAGAKSSDIRIADNRFEHLARAYRDNVAIMAGFVNGLDIAHNTLRDLPYSGISVGWGWNYEGTAPVQSSIHIVGNRISRVMQQLADGGAIYTQGMAVPGTSCIVRNDIDMRGSEEGNGIYLDEHSQYFLVRHNLVLGSWVSAWAAWSGHLRIVDNWTDTAGKPHHRGPTKQWSPNFTGLKSLPAAALAVQCSAGIRAEDGTSRTPRAACGSPG